MQKKPDHIDHKEYRDVSVTVKKINHEEEVIKQPEPSNSGLTSIAYAKKADNPKGASYAAVFKEVDDMKFGIAVTKSLR
jgi:hypothetical protein